MKSDPNLSCHDALLVVWTDDMSKSFMIQLSEEVLLKETGLLVVGTEHTFFGRKLRHNGDSIDVCMPQAYIDSILDQYVMQAAGAVTIAKTGLTRH